MNQIKIQFFNFQNIQMSILLLKIMIPSEYLVTWTSI